MINESSILDSNQFFFSFACVSYQFNLNSHLSEDRKIFFSCVKSGAMYPSSKNKASFRIADILHQQQQQQQTDSQLLAHHLMLKNGVQSSASNKNSNLKSHSSENGKDLSVASKSPSPETSPVPEVSHEHGMTKVDAPMKPTPMYTNFPMPFPLGIHPAFHPAAYLNYADAIHKGETRQPIKLHPEW